MSYVLYDEFFWNDRSKRYHEVETTRFSSLEEAKDEMEYRYCMHMSGCKTSVILNRSAMIVYNDKNESYDRMRLYGIMEEA